jgi:DNA primase large subunit
MMKEQLSSRILSISTPKEIAEATGIPQEKLIVNKEFDPFAVIEVDTVLISSRHLFRSPYSINEKSGLVSVVLPREKIKNFKPSSAKIENIETILPFLPQPEQENEASQLLVQAFDYAKKHPLLIQDITAETKPHGERSKITTKVPEELFPPCIKLLLQGMATDGRKRALFIMINFLKQMNFTLDEVESTLLDWNKKNYEPLREGYIKAQMSWHRRNQQNILPPNCANDGYYVPMGVCKPDNYCSKIRNPTNYSLLRMRIQQETKKPKRKKSAE